MKIGDGVLVLKDHPMFLPRELIGIGTITGIGVKIGILENLIEVEINGKRSVVSEFQIVNHPAIERLINAQSHK